MSGRVTRSSARKSADLSAPTNPHPPDPQNPDAQPSARKRKASPSIPNVEGGESPTGGASHQQRRKRTRRSNHEAPPLASTSSRKRKSNQAAVMSSPGELSKTDPDQSTPDASSSKKKSKGKETPGSQPSKRRSSTNKKGKKTKEPTTSGTAEQSPEATTLSRPNPHGSSGEEVDEDGEGVQRAYEDDEAMDDPFESALLARHGGPGGMSSTLRALSGMMAGTNTKLRTLLEKLRQDEDPSEQLVALQELSELLLVSTEDNLAGNFAPDSFLKELVKLMQPTTFGENPEMMLLACRCVANMMEALPTSTASVVYGNAVPVLVSKLLEIQFMDLAEQALITLEKISSEFPASIVREGGLTACLTYLDFFATSVQRTAVTTAANCCRNIPEDSFATVKEVMPILLNVLSSNDQRVVEQGCLCISRIADSFKFQDDKIEDLMSTDILKAILRLLLPGSTNLVGANIHTQFLRVLSTTARASPKLTAELIKLNIVETLYQVLTGVSPPSGIEDVAQKIDSVVIMQALIHRPRDQVFETLNVICELLPSLEKDQSNFVSELAANAGHPGELSLPKGNKNTRQQRLDLLADCKPELRRFAVVLLPTLTDAYSSTVNLSVRQKVLVAQLRMLSYLETDILEDALRPVPYSSYLASMLSQQDHPYLVTSALQASVLLLRRLEHIYRYQFYREGVVAEIRKLAERPLENPPTEPTKPAANEGAPPAPDAEVPAPTNAADNPERHENPESDDEGEDLGAVHDDMSDGEEEESSDSEVSPMVPDAIPSAANVRDAITTFARRFLDNYEKTESGLEAKGKAENILETLRNLVTDIAKAYDAGQSEEGTALFSKLAKYFEGDALESVTSHELLSSKVVSTLLDIFQEPDGRPNQAARSAFVEVFMGSISQQKMRTASSQSPATAFSVLVAKLQDLLSRAEHFEVITVHSNSFDSNRGSPASVLAKQIRVKLMADGEAGVPAPFRNIMVSIHAIANFKSLDDFLRPRIALSERVSSRRPPSAALGALGGAEGADPSSHFGQPSDPAFSWTAAGGEPIPPPPPAISSRSRGGSRGLSRGGPRGGSARGRGGLSSARDPPTPEETSPSSSSRKASRTRKSSRHTKQQQGGTATPPMPPPPPSAGEGLREGLRNALECADEAHVSENDDQDDEQPFDEIIDEFEETMDEDRPEPEAVNMEVAETGRVTARQDDGTRVETPTSNRRSSSRASSNSLLAASSRSGPPPTGRSFLSSLASRQLSYASAAQQIPQNWHLEFSVNGQPIGKDTTIYRAVHFGQGPNDEMSARNVWSQVHPINFKRVEGPPPAESTTLTPTSETAPSVATSGMPQSLGKNPITSEILRLLRILHEMNSNLEDFVAENRTGVKLNAEPVTQFVNTKLTAKLNRQLEEPLIVASNCLPSWSEDLAQLYPFLFPFETRHLFLQSTSFGYSRSMSRWQNAQPAIENHRHRHRDERPFLGRLQRQKVRIARHKLLESAVKVLEIYGASPSILEVEFFDEVGTGLGPTLEFYSNVSKEFSKKKLQMWRENESTKDKEHVFGKQGLFPAPMGEEQWHTENGRRVLGFFKALGKFVARSMLDSRIIDVSFNPMFFRIASDAQPPPSSSSAVKTVDEDLAQSLQTIKQYTAARKKVMEEPRLSVAQKAQKLARVQVRGASIDDLGLDFTLPGYPSIELIPNGAQTAVSIDNVPLYLDKVIEFTLGKGITKQITAFKFGFSQVFPYNAMKAFTPDELVMLFGRVDEDWTLETLMDSTKADHGYNLDSKSVRNLMTSMSELTISQRRDFLQFITGSPKLPIGGFKSLTPMFTVVCKPSEAPYAPDDYLPSVMTCVNYLKLPDYSNLDVMRRQLGTAIREGQGAFHLS